MLSCAGLTKNFMGIQALGGVTMHVDKGEILGVIGPNGAGKTTLFNVLTGLFRPDAGTITFENREITRLAPYHRVRIGMARTFQNLEIFHDMNVLENVMVGAHARLKNGFWSSLLALPKKQKEEKALRQKAMGLLELLGIEDKALEQATNLSYGNQRRVEIARALASEPALLFLDEPAAGMNPKETEEIAQLIKKLKHELALTVVIIEHDMNLIMDICSRIVVMTEGQVLTSGAPQEVRTDPRVLEAYLGA